MAMVMATAMITPMKTPVMIDLHNHALFEVDDGSKSIDMTLEMMHQASDTHVHTIVLTPHVNSSETRVDRQTHIERYEALKKRVSHLPLTLILGAEIFIGQRLPLVDFDTLCYGPHKTLLIEFSPFMETPIVDHAFNLIKKGYQVIIAHIERYMYLSLEDIVELRTMGAIIQVNTSSVLKIGHPEHAKKGRDLIRQGFVDVIATDSHNPTVRPQNLSVAYETLKTLVSEDKALSLVSDYAFQNILQ